MTWDALLFNSNNADIHFALTCPLRSKMQLGIRDVCSYTIEVKFNIY